MINTHRVIMLIMKAELPPTIASVSDLFDRFDGPKGVARIISKGHSTASEMKRRASIPVEYWPALIDSDKGQELGLTAEHLMRIHATERAEA